MHLESSLIELDSSPIELKSSLQIELENSQIELEISLINWRALLLIEFMSIWRLREWNRTIMISIALVISIVELFQKIWP